MTLTPSTDEWNYVHEHDDWADGDCTRCLRIDTYRALVTT